VKPSRTEARVTRRPSTTVGTRDRYDPRRATSSATTTRLLRFDSFATSVRGRVATRSISSTVVKGVVNGAHLIGTRALQGGHLKPRVEVGEHGSRLAVFVGGFRDVGVSSVCMRMCVSNRSLSETKARAARKCRHSHRRFLACERPARPAPAVTRVEWDRVHAWRTTTS